ncbi:hypothetical protein TNCV_2170271 [Trichonephila clavipes]|nr:hypothetical protein TNCV_2170271 [Trichonephila clavipes]
MVAQRLAQITPLAATPDQLCNVWKLLGLLYPKNTSKVSLNQCRGVWQSGVIVIACESRPVHPNARVPVGLKQKEECKSSTGSNHKNDRLPAFRPILTKHQRRYNNTISLRTHKDIKDKRDAAIYTYPRRRAGDKTQTAMITW